mgnify:CR=1 FL=1
MHCNVSKMITMDNPQNTFSSEEEHLAVSQRQHVRVRLPVGETVVQIDSGTGISGKNMGKIFISVYIMNDRKYSR